MFDRRLIQSFDWGLLAVVLLLSLFGLVTLFSAVHSDAGGSQRALFYRQVVWFSGGSGALIFCFLFNYRVLERWAMALYLGACALLVAVAFIGRVSGGSRRWLVLGPLTLQPSELAKIAMILALARYFAKHVRLQGLTWRELSRPAMLVALPFFLIVAQPDLGTAMMLVFIAASMTLFVKIERRTLIGLILGALVMVPAVWFLLKGYQQQRILTFLNPERDPLGTGYHIIQSKIAIGSGMISGKGFLKGTQNALSFLPEQHTDFIFSVLAEQWGFMGTMLLLSLFLVFFLRAINVAYRCRDPFGTLLAVGVGSLIFWQMFINIGMVMGLMPVVGVPLPLISYGGSSILTTMIGMGLLMNVSMRRFLFE